MSGFKVFVQFTNFIILDNIYAIKINYYYIFIVFKLT